MTPIATRLRLVIVMLAWLAQALLPVAHAGLMAQPKAGGQIWCGDAASAQAALALLPDELRAALDDGNAFADHLPDCAQFCASASALNPQALAPVAALRAAGLEAPAVARDTPTSRPQAPPPPSHAPPARD